MVYAIVWASVICDFMDYMWSRWAWIVLEATTHMGLISVMSSFLDVSIGAGDFSMNILLGSDQY